MKVLIVDDSPDALALARHRLAPEGVELLTADGGAAGLETAARAQPDLILLDLDMPGMSGFDVCRALKGDAKLASVPVIFLSGSGQAEDKVKGLDLGAVDYITKPFDAFELRARVRAALRTKRLQDLLTERARLDPLTGLANRGGFDERLGQEWARAGRGGGALSVVMADVDHFKRVNDAFGHAAGDTALRAVADAIAGQCRASDLPCRHGGEEFAVIAPDERAAGALRLAERCRQAVAAIDLPAGHAAIRLTASFGVADSATAQSPEEIVQQADQAMYRAKARGRNTAEVFGP